MLVVVVVVVAPENGPGTKGTWYKLGVSAKSDSVKALEQVAPPLKRKHCRKEERNLEAWVALAGVCVAVAVGWQPVAGWGWMWVLWAWMVVPYAGPAAGCRAEKRPQ